ncbi:MAG: hypothetical protein FWH57_12015 [Oscillospiraceae bacterium]|nr:hypothetical protein [Oscillospiraceae bacterium]
METFARLAARLTDTYKDHETRIETIEGIEYFVIVNPFWEEDIRVLDQNGIIFRFSYQHAHFDCCEDIDEDIDELIEYIDEFIEKERVALDFFQGKTDLFGGSRKREEIDTSSGIALLKSFFKENDTFYELFYKRMQGAECRCSIRGWNNAHNEDIDFVL